MTRAVLHIGTTKTGTSFLQGLFLANREALLESGVVYPDLDGRLNHSNLALTFNSATGRRHEQVGVTDRDATRASLDAYFVENVQPGQRWLLSTENASKLNDEDAADLVAFLKQYFDEIQIIVYMRRREFLLASRFSQRLKDGGGTRLTWDKLVANLRNEDPNLLVDRWVGIAGSDHVTVRPYLEEFKRDSSALLQDFCSFTELDVSLLTPAEQDGAPPLRNTSLSAEGVEFLQNLNQFLPEHTTDGSANITLRRKVVNRIQKLTPGKGLMVPEDILAQATEVFAASNATLVSRFDDDEWRRWIDQVPKGADVDTPPMTPARTMEILLGLSKPAGPADFATPDWRPRPKPKPPTPPTFGQRVKRKLVGKK